MNLRRRVTASLAAVVALFVTVQGVLAFLSLEDQEDDLADELVTSQARALSARADRGDLTGPRAGELLQPVPHVSAWFVDAGGKTIPGPLPAYLATLSDGPHRPLHPGQELHAVVLTTTNGRLYVQYDAELNEAKVREYGYYLIGLGIVCVTFGALVAWRVAGWVVAPIERLAARLAEWVPDAQAGEKATTDEESRLLNAFGRMQGRFEHAVAREREFVANVSHEIRTPLAALRTDLEMLDTHGGAGWAERPRVTRALGAVDAITGALESARTVLSQRHVDAQRVPLASCVDDAWASLESMPGIDRLRFSNEIPKHAVASADRHALLTILRNLIRNAVEHAAPARCAVRLTTRGIEVVDDGPGIAVHDLPFVFDRYYRGRFVDAPTSERPSDATDAGALPPGPQARPQRGLGLAIARQIAELNGWRLTVESVTRDEPQQSVEHATGTRFILALGAI